MNQQHDKLLNLTLRFLGFRPRSRQEVVKYLQKKTSDSRLTDQLINRLTELKLIDDAEFARWYVESRSHTRPRSARLLALELRRKGIDTKTMNDHRMTTNDEIALAKRALEKKLRLWSNLPDKEFRHKAVQFLMTRGFSWDVIEKTLKTAYNDTDVN